MKTHLKYLFAWMPIFANDNDAMTPEWWANEGLIILEENQVMAGLVHRDFDPQFARYGDVVNAYRPQNTEVRRRSRNSGAFTTDDSITDAIPVRMNQWLYQSRILYDGEMSQALPNLMEQHLKPMVIAISNGIDRICAYRLYQFKANLVGQLGVAPTRSALTALDRKANELLWPLENRNVVVPPSMKEAFMNDANLVTADKAGDQGTRMRELSLGRLHGFNAFMDQNLPSITSPVLAVQLGDADADFPAGSTVITLDGSADTWAVGTFVTIEGD